MFRGMDLAQAQRHTSPVHRVEQERAVHLVQLDKRNLGSTVLGRIFTGKSATIRPEVNRDGMQETLRRLKSELESGPQPAAKKLR
jgi:hypothetical protein